MKYFIEAQANALSTGAGDTRIIARGGYGEMLRLFPVIVASALERGYEMVAVYDAQWNVVCQWSWKGAA